MDTEPTASSDTEAPEPHASEEAPPAQPAALAPPAAPGPPAPPEAPPPHDVARRAFFKEFSRQALTTVGHVAGMANVVSQASSSAATSLLGLDEPKTRVVSTPTVSPRAASAAKGSVDHTYRSAYRLEGDTVVLLDQRVIPENIEEQVCRRGSDVAYHLRVGVCRGGPVMAQVAAYGLAMTARERLEQSAESRWREIKRTRNALVGARPSSRLPGWAMERLDSVLERLGEDAPSEAVAKALWAEADDIATQFQSHHSAIASHLVANLPNPADRPLTVLLHGNPGALSGGLFGTAISALSMLAEQDRDLRVFVTETRPFMEGARLASWELRQLDIEHHVIVDSAVAWLFAREPVDAVLIAPEWIAADGAASAVIGSRAIAQQAAAAPPGPDGARPRVLVCGSSVNVDPGVADGAAIPVELRPARELSAYLAGVEVRATGAMVPATDVMPAELIGGLVTEQGLTSPVTPAAVAALVGGAVPEAS